MAKIAAMIAKKPFTAREMLVKWVSFYLLMKGSSLSRTVEFAAEFGPSPALRPQSFDMSWVEYHNVDIIVFIVTFIGVIVFIMGKIVSSVFRAYFREKPKLDWASYVSIFDKENRAFLMCLTCVALSSDYTSLTLRAPPTLSFSLLE